MDYVTATSSSYYFNQETCSAQNRPWLLGHQLQTCLHDGGALVPSALRSVPGGQAQWELGVEGSTGPGATSSHYRVMPYTEHLMEQNHQLENELCLFFSAVSSSERVRGIFFFSFSQQRDQVLCSGCLDFCLRGALDAFVFNHLGDRTQPSWGLVTWRTENDQVLLCVTLTAQASDPPLLILACKEGCTGHYLPASTWTSWPGLMPLARLTSDGTAARGRRLGTTPTRPVDPGTTQDPVKGAT
ncbi:uncharacterized protein LOC116572789 [Mustela erminea]|uniref:uncharacterized protein LOC116572789 n=1 Tax=Mustela erminea TaxID=36723 RepID=UPI001386B619|nr:uncharacterized protein LOC116572789 [Mustela erminea]